LSKTEKKIPALNSSDVGYAYKINTFIIYYCGRCIKASDTQTGMQLVGIGIIVVILNK
jgi:hypothetical protein